MYELIAKNNIGEVIGNGTPNRKVKVGEAFKKGLENSQPEVKEETVVQEPMVNEPVIENYSTNLAEEFKPDVVISKTPIEPVTLETPNPITFDTPVVEPIKSEIPNPLADIPAFEPVAPKLDKVVEFPVIEPTLNTDNTQPDLGDTMVLPPMSTIINENVDNRTFDMPALSGNTDIEKYVLKVEGLLKEYKSELENTYNRKIDELKLKYENQIEQLNSENKRLIAERLAAVERADSLENSIRTIVGINGRPTYSSDEYSGKDRHVA